MADSQSCTPYGSWTLDPSSVNSAFMTNCTPSQSGRVPLRESGWRRRSSTLEKHRSRECRSMRRVLSLRRKKA